MSHLFIRCCMALVMGLVLAMGTVSTASAHAQLLSTEPADSAILGAPPAAVTLEFNEPVSPLAVSLIGPDGVPADLLAAAKGSERITITLPTALPNGTHVLSWRVVSTDGHPVAGASIFSIGSATATPTAPSTDPAVAMALWAGRTLLLAGLLLGVGGAAFGAITRVPARSDLLTTALAASGLVLAPLVLGVQGLDALGLPLAAIGEGSAWIAGLGTSYGATTLALVIAFVLTVLAVRITHRTARLLLAALAATTGALALSLSGHASAAAPQWLTRPAVFLHVASLLFWIGALLPLLGLLAERTAHANRALARFSCFIPFAVAILLASGATLAVIQLGTPGPQWLSPYGYVLAAKLALVLLLFALALHNRLRLTGPTLAGDASAARHLRQSILAELVLVLCILALVAGWRFTPPPRALALIQAQAQAPAAAPALAHLMEGNVMAMVLVSPAQAGPVTLDIAITTPDGAPLAPQSVAVTLSEPALGIEGLQRVATGADSSWQVNDLTIPVPGTWRIALTIRLGRFEQVGLQGELATPPGP